MSRCFPFPPPGFVKVGAGSGDCAIEMESIKLHKEKRRAEKEQRKEKKRLKKLKKEQLNKQIEASCGKTVKLNDTKSLLENTKSKRDSCASDGGALSDDSTKSGLSEEHGLPLPSNFFELSDGNDSTKKRKRDDPVPPISERNGTKLKVSFTFRKPNNSESPTEAPLVQNHSASETLVTRRDEQPCSTSQAQLPLNNKLPTTAATRDNKCVLDGAAQVKPSHSHKRKSSSSGSKHTALFEEWCPLPLLSEEETSDQEWLFCANQRVAKVARTIETSDALTSCCRGAYNSFPRADYLPEAEIYVLPFTVPF